VKVLSREPVARQRDAILEPLDAQVPGASPCVRHADGA
jgi:hypothetical protein